MTRMPRAWPRLTSWVVKSWWSPGWGGTFPPRYQAYPLAETANVWMTLAPSPAYQARCCSGSASAQSPGGAKPLGPPGPQLKSMQKARMASPARRPGLPVCKSRTVAHKTAPLTNRLRIEWRCLAEACATAGCSLHASRCSLAAAPFPSPPLEERGRERRSSSSARTPDILGRQPAGMSPRTAASRRVTGLLSPTLSSKGGEGEPLARCSRPPDACKVEEPAPAFEPPHTLRQRQQAAAPATP